MALKRAPGGARRRLRPLGGTDATIVLGVHVSASIDQALYDVGNPSARGQQVGSVASGVLASKLALLKIKERTKETLSNDLSLPAQARCRQVCPLR